MFHILKNIIGCLIILFIGLLIIVNNFSLFDCHEKEKYKVYSPNLKFSAITVELNCGATTSYATFVELKKNQQALNANKLIVFGIDGSEDISPIWNSNNELTLKYSKSDRSTIFKQIFFNDQIRIKYKKIDHIEIRKQDL